MIHDPVAVLAVAVALGVGAQWLANRLRLPSIVLMLAVGLLVGPGLGLIDPAETFGDELLSPVIALGVGLLLFEGGLGLRWAEIGSTTRRVVLRLLSVGVLTTLVLTSIAALALTDLPRGVAILFGAIMVVTGPTVVIPLLRQARLRPRLGRILRWEGIIVDPVGAVLGVSVLEVLLVEDGSLGEAIVAVARTTVVGCAVGALVAVALLVVLGRHWVPDHLRGPLSLVAAIGAYALANELGTDAGLYAATVAGVVLANQRQVAIEPIVELHEDLATIILATIFVILGAGVQAETLTSNLVPAALLLVVLVVVVRPVAVLVSTAGTPLTRKERIYLASLAPRGIVAASVSAVFGFELTEAGLPGGEDLAAITFLVVAGTTVVYGPLARPLAHRLQVDTPEPTGVVLVGARPWARRLGAALSDIGVPVLIVAESEELADQARGGGPAGLRRTAGGRRPGRRPRRGGRPHRGGGLGGRGARCLRDRPGGPPPGPGQRLARRPGRGGPAGPARRRGPRGTPRLRPDHPGAPRRGPAAPRGDGGGPRSRGAGDRDRDAPSCW